MKREIYKLVILVAARAMAIGMAIAIAILIVITLTGCAGAHGLPDITDGLGFTHHKDAENERIQEEQHAAFLATQKANPPCGLTINGVCQGTVPYSDPDHKKD